MRFDLALLADQIFTAISAAEGSLRLEQAVYGLDSLDEPAIQTLVADGLRANYEIAREAHYPSSAGQKASHRQRCDWVLCTPGRPLRLDRHPPTLFDPPDPTPPQEALWMEVKVAYQFREGGVRHGGYGTQWRSSVVEDLRKMEADPLIHEAALLLVVFNESADVLEKDLELFEVVLAEKEVLAGFRQVRSVPVQDRIGHRICTVTIWPTVQR